MSSSVFRIVEHNVPCQHIREYPGATANEQEEPLHLAVKQYIPLDNPNPQPGDVTILGAHANGFPKVRRKSVRLPGCESLQGQRVVLGAGQSDSMCLTREGGLFGGL